MDVVWIGFSLHHLLGPAKLEFMREVRSVVGDRGLFLIYETASPDGEDREAPRRRPRHRIDRGPLIYQSIVAMYCCHDDPQMAVSKRSKSVLSLGMAGPLKVLLGADARLSAGKDLVNL